MNTALLSDAVFHQLEETSTQPTECLVKRSKYKVLCKYEETSKSWRDVIRIPQWVDVGSASCSYQLYVITVGARDQSNSRHVVMVDMKTVQIINLFIFYQHQ